MQGLERFLPPLTRSGLVPARRLLLAEFFRFGVVGTLGFVWDTMTVYGLAPFVGLYVAGIGAYFVAASANWLLNRIWTFRGRSTGRPARQWVRFLIANLAGFALNRGVYVALIAGSAEARAAPVLAVAAGSVAGMFVNFVLSRRYVYR